MDLPMMDFLLERNVYTGNAGDFRYRLEPDGAQLKVWAYQTYCFTYCKENGLLLGESAFPLTTEGLAQAVDWLELQKTTHETNPAKIF